MDAVAARRLLQRRRRMFDSTSWSMAAVDDSIAGGRTRRNIFYITSPHSVGSSPGSLAEQATRHALNDRTWSTSNGIIFSNGGQRRGVQRPPSRARPPPPEPASKSKSRSSDIDYTDSAHRFSGAQALNDAPALREQNEKLDIDLRNEKKAHANTKKTLEAQLSGEKQAHEVTRKLLEQRISNIQRIETEKKEQQEEFDTKLSSLDEDAYKRAQNTINREQEAINADIERRLEDAKEQQSHAAEALKSLEDFNRTVKRENNDYLAEQAKEIAEKSREEFDQRWDKFEEVLSTRFKEELEQIERGRAERRQERSSYKDYRDIWSQLDFRNGALNEQLKALESLLDRKVSSWRQTLKDFNPEKIQQWLPHRYPKLVRQLESMLAGKLQEAEQSANTMKGMLQEIENAKEEVRISGHYSRVSTRYHRFAEENLTAQSVAVCSELLNDAPLVGHRRRLARELASLDSRIKSSVPGRRREHYEQSRAVMKQDLDNAVVLSNSSFYLRRAAQFEVLAQASPRVQELYLRPLAVKELLDEGDRAWFNYQRALESSSDKGDSKERSAFRSTRSDLKDGLRNLEQTIRRRQLLQEGLGQSVGARDREETKKKIARYKSDAEAIAFERLRHVSRVSSVRSSGAHLSGGSLTKVEQLEQQMNVLRRKLFTTQSLAAKKALQKEIAILDVRYRKAQKQREEVQEVKIEEQANDRQAEADDVNASRVTSAEAAKKPSKRASKVTPSPKKRKQFREKQVAATKADPASEPQPEKPVAEESKAGTGLNIQPTASKQAAHAFWPMLALRSNVHNSTLSTGGAAEALHTNGDSYIAACATSQRNPSTDAHSQGGRSGLSHGKQPGSKMAKSVTDSQTDSQRSDAGEGEEAAEMFQSTQSSYQPSQQSDQGSMASQSASDNEHDSTTGTDSGVLPQLAYNMSKEDHRNALLASPNTSAHFWTYKLHKNADGKTPLVYYCTNLEQAERQAKEFLEEPVIGFDIEWEMRHTPGKSGIKKNVSLIQIAADDKIALFHLAVFKGNTVDELMPASLRQILESRDVIKAGVNIQGDAWRMDECLNVKMTGIFELSHLYRVVMFSDTPNQINRKPFKLAEQVQNVLFLPLKKDAVRTSAWSKKLDMQQTEYAASDAYAGFRLFHALEAKRQMMDPMPPRPAFWEEHKPIQLGDGTLIQAKSGKKAATGASKKATEMEDDDEDEEFFDAVENQDAYGIASGEKLGEASSSTRPSISYPALSSLSDQLAESMDSLQITSPPSSTANAQPPAPSLKRPGPPPSPAIDEAERWVSTFRASLPPEYALQATHVQLRAYALWHAQRLDCKQVAAALREPPLSLQTVATYVLEAVRHEGFEVEGERLRGVVEVLPGSVRGRYKRLLEGAGVRE